MADVATEDPKENVIPATKTVTKEDSPPKLNGIDTDVTVNGNTDEHQDKGEEMETETSGTDLTSHRTNGDMDKNDSSQSLETTANSPNEGENEKEEKENANDSKDKVDSPADDNSGEVMEVDGKDDDEVPDIVEVSSNVSAHDLCDDDDPNNSRNPSIISEDDSRDSINSNTSEKSKHSTESNTKDGLKVKVDDGDEFLITLNNDEDDDNNKDEMETEDSDEKLKNEKTDEKKVNDESKKDVSDKTIHVEVIKEHIQPLSSASTGPIAMQPKSTVSFPAKAVSLLNQANPNVSSILIPTTGIAFTGLSQSNIIVPGAAPGIQLIKQGNQLGYLTMGPGNQKLFIPVSGVQLQQGQPLTNSVIASQLNVSAQQQQTSLNTKPQASQVQVTQITQEELRPKSSIEMIELMKWELQNRVADNYNWSVAFHPRKDELSSITSFLQELGSDVVKEQVYKDIIQIQTKKKDNGDLKNSEVESLEKMKTVYENTKKKVEHLQLDTNECERCKFRTESSVVMNYHEDFPHYDPPWDISRGWMECSHCSFRTKVAPQFIFHMKDIHNAQAKFLERTQPFQCSLCPLNAASKNKLERHQQKCTKHFKMNNNLQPYYHDVNFCMKTCYYKPRKPPPPPQPKPAPKPAAPTMSTRQQAGNLPQQQARGQTVIRPGIPPPRLQPMGKAPLAPMPAHRSMNAQKRPRLNPPPLQRAPMTPQQQQQLQRPSRPAGKDMAGFEVCELCGGYVKDRQALRIHFYYAHKVEMPQAVFNRPTAPLTCEICKDNFWTTQGLSKHKTAKRHFSTNIPPPTTKMLEQQCFMCLRKYPNLFVHFERVHGMTMKDLILVMKCIMCGASTSDYKSLESHLLNAHGVMIKVADYINAVNVGDNKKSAPSYINVEKNKPLIKTASTTVISGGKNVGKINYCVFCQIQFPDNIQLTMHCFQNHTTCQTCNMVVASIKHLTRHSCRKAHINKPCNICGTKVASQEKYVLHLRSHVKPCKIQLNNLNDDEIESLKEKIKREYKPAVISLDSDEDSDDVVEVKPGETKVETVKKTDVETIDLSDDSKGDENVEKDKLQSSEKKVLSGSNLEENETENINEKGDSENTSEKNESLEQSNNVEINEVSSDIKDNVSDEQESKVQLADDSNNEKETKGEPTYDENSKNDLNSQSDIDKKGDTKCEKEPNTESSTDETCDMDTESQPIAESNNENETSAQCLEENREKETKSQTATETTVDKTESQVDKTSENNAEVQSAMDDNELLKSDEDSNTSSEHKRKISGSDIDEDELLGDGDQSSSKKIKLDDEIINDDKQESNTSG